MSCDCENNISKCTKDEVNCVECEELTETITNDNNYQIADAFFGIFGMFRVGD